MQNRFEYKLQKPDKKDFYKLFRTTGWYESYKLTEDKLELALNNSWFMVSVYYKEQLVGFGRIISDKSLHALILDVIVLPDFQNNGIGTKIMKILTGNCLSEGIIDIQLFCAEGKTDFYEKLGYEKRNNNAPGMQYKRKTGEMKWKK